MKKRHFIIDAYNYISQSYPSFRKNNSDLSQGVLLIQKTIDKLTAFSESNNSDTTLVFDGDNQGFGTKNSNPDILFSGKYVNADTLIKRMLDKIHVKHGTIVVTSDREICSYAKLSGFDFMTSDDFHILMTMKSSKGTNDEINDYSENIKSQYSEFDFSSPLEQPTKKPQKKESAKSKYKGTEFYGGFNESLSEEEINDLIGDVKLATSKKTYKTDSKPKKSYHSENDKELGLQREKQKQEKQKTEKNKIERIDLTELRKKWGNNTEKD